MAPGKKHEDHDHIVARQERYIAVWRTGSSEKLMEFMHKQDFTLSNFGNRVEGLSHSAAKEQFEHGFKNFHDLDIQTRSLHGHKHFTAWEWVMTCKTAVDADGKKLSQAEAPSNKLVGCTLAWWDDDDKIVKSHEYYQALD